MLRRALICIIAWMHASERLTAGAIGAVLIAASVLVVLCNWWDWDVFLTFNEVDRRAWVLNHELPLWSYQFCGGVTRIGDPQSFGLSPLFAVVLLFGSFWGSKLMVILSLGYGLWVSGRLLQLVATAGGDTPMPTSVVYTLATLFITGNFFLWHLSVGHFSYLSFFLALGIVYYTLVAYLRGLRRGETVMATFVVWQHFSGGFYQSTAYLLVPFYLALGLYWIASPSLGAGWASCLRGLRRAIPFHAMGVVLSSYKLVAVWRYQAEYPRVLPEVHEAFTPLHLLVAQIVPTLGNHWPVPIDMGPWDLHEWSVFSLLPIALLVMVLRARSSSPRASGIRPHPNPLAGFVWIYGAVAVSFALGEFSEIAPFTLLNRLVFGGSMRIIGRFGIGITFSIALACALLHKGSRTVDLSPLVCFLLLIGALVNLLTFSWITSASRTAHLASLPTSSRAEMKTLVNASLLGPGARLAAGHELVTTENTTRMYGPTRDGEAIINCYNPLPRPQTRGQPQKLRFSMLGTDRGSIGPSCLEESYFTQNQLHIGPSCPKRVCLLFKWINIYAPPAGIRYDAEQDLFCRDDE